MFDREKADNNHLCVCVGGGGGIYFYVYLPIIRPTVNTDNSKWNLQSLRLWIYYWDRAKLKQ